MAKVGKSKSAIDITVEAGRTIIAGTPRLLTYSKKDIALYEAGHKVEAARVARELAKTVQFIECTTWLRKGLKQFFAYSVPAGAAARKQLIAMVTARTKGKAIFKNIGQPRYKHILTFSQAVLNGKANPGPRTQRRAVRGAVRLWGV